MLRSEEKLHNQSSIKLVFAYFILVVGTMANLVIWTDFRPTPSWLIFLAGLESLVLINIWLGRFIAKTFWEKSVRISFWILFALLLLRLSIIPFVAA